MIVWRIKTFRGALGLLKLALALRVMQSVAVLTTSQGGMPARVLEMGGALAVALLVSLAAMTVLIVFDAVRNDMMVRAVSDPPCRLGIWVRRHYVGIYMTTGALYLAQAFILAAADAPVALLIGYVLVVGHATIIAALETSCARDAYRRAGRPEAAT